MHAGSILKSILKQWDWIQFANIFFSLLKTDKKARLIVFIIAYNSIYTDNRKRNRKNLSKFFKRCKCTKHADNWGGDGNWVFHPMPKIIPVAIVTYLFIVLLQPYKSKSYTRQYYSLIALCSDRTIITGARLWIYHFCLECTTVRGIIIHLSFIFQLLNLSPSKTVQISVFPHIW